jgi:hypothetical protein
MQLEKKKSHNNINNKNIVNVIINTSKDKNKKSLRKSYNASSNDSSGSQNDNAYNSSVNLQHEILRNSLNVNPQINRPSNPSNKIRDDETAFIDEGSAFPRVDLGEDFSNIFTTPRPNPMKYGAKPKKQPKRSTKQYRLDLLEDYKRMGGDDPLILNSTRKNTIENAIKRLSLLNVQV